MQRKHSKLLLMVAYSKYISSAEFIKGCYL